MPKLKKRLLANEITSVWRLGKENIYYYNMQDAPKYRKATLVIFGMKQYHTPTPKRELISQVLQVMKDVTSIDVCLDIPYKPNIEVVSRHFKLKPFITNKGVVTDTRYINDTSDVTVVASQKADKSFKYAGRYKAFLDIADFAIDGVSSDDTLMLGFELEGNLADTGVELRSEGAYIKNTLKTLTSPEEKEFFQAIVGADYGFTNGVTLIAEALYSSENFSYEEILLNYD